MEQANAHDRLNITLSGAVKLFQRLYLHNHKQSSKLWYIRKLHQFVDYIGPETPLRQIEEVHLDLYVSSLSDSRQFWANNPYTNERKGIYKPTTIKNHCVAIKTLFRWLRKRRYIDRNPAEVIEPPKIKNYNVDPVPIDHVEALLEHLTKKRNWRDRAIIKLVVSTGIRSCGLASIGIDNLSVIERWVHVVEKRNTERTLPFDNRTAEYLADYVSHRELHSVDGFFISTNTTYSNGLPYRMTGHGFRQMLYRQCKAVGLPKYSPHQLRHTFATEAVRRGCGEMWLQLMLGHEIGSVATKAYVQSGLDHLRLEYDRLFRD